MPGSPASSLRSPDAPTAVFATCVAGVLSSSDGLRERDRVPHVLKQNSRARGGIVWFPRVAGASLDKR